MAPEVIKGIYIEKCDCWSLGIILYLMFIGDVPFNAKTDSQIYVKILNIRFMGMHATLIHTIPIYNYLLRLVF